MNKKAIEVLKVGTGVTVSAVTEMAVAPFIKNLIEKTPMYGVNPALWKIVCRIAEWAMVYCTGMLVFNQTYSLLSDLEDMVDSADDILKRVKKNGKSS